MVCHFDRSENLPLAVCNSNISKGASAVYMKHRQNTIYHQINY